MHMCNLCIQVRDLRLQKSNAHTVNTYYSGDEICVSHKLYTEPVHVKTEIYLCVSVEMSYSHSSLQQRLKNYLYECATEVKTIFYS